jgi:Na+-driven multidrug efflux pump
MFMILLSKAQVLAVSGAMSTAEIIADQEAGRRRAEISEHIIWTGYGLSFVAYNIGALVLIGVGHPLAGAAMLGAEAYGVVKFMEALGSMPHG